MSPSIFNVSGIFKVTSDLLHLLFYLEKMPSSYIYLFGVCVRTRVCACTACNSRRCEEVKGLLGTDSFPHVVSGDQAQVGRFLIKCLYPKAAPWPKELTFFFKKKNQVLEIPELLLLI